MDKPQEDVKMRHHPLTKQEEQCLAVALDLAEQQAQAESFPFEKAMGLPPLQASGIVCDVILPSLRAKLLNI